MPRTRSILVSLYSNLNYDWLHSESESYIATDIQPASQSWNKAPIWGVPPSFFTVRQLRVCWCGGVLSDERKRLSFTIAAGPRQRSHSRVRVPWNSRPYFTVSDSRLRFLSPPTTHRATVEVFDPASTRDWLHSESESEAYLRTGGQSVSLSWIKHSYFILIWTVSYIAYLYPRKCLLITRIHGNVFRNELVSKNQTQQKRVCQLVS
jgi:hypothetical protein